MPEFERSRSEMEAAAMGATRATARAVEPDAERISVHLTAVPSFEAFGRALDAASPFAFWAQVAHLAWQPGLAATSGMALPPRLEMPQRSREKASRSAPERGSVGGGMLHLAPPP
jgi:hypothetical protein